MTDYLYGVFFLNFLVDILLLLAASGLCGFPARWYRILLGGLLGGIHSACCLIPGFFFLGNTLWRMITLVLIAMLSYGISLVSAKKAILFTLLSFALGGAVTGMEKGGALGTLIAASVITLLCYLGFQRKLGAAKFLPVELSYGDNHVRITALQDTGNTLRDPVTGRQVLVVGADVAAQLTGLSAGQLRTPVESMGLLPGLRLIPYRSVGVQSFLLAIHLPKVKIGSWQGGTLVAFAPDCLSPEGTYQGLTGGVV